MSANKKKEVIRAVGRLLIAGPPWEHWSSIRRSAPKTINVARAQDVTRPDQKIVPRRKARNRSAASTFRGIARLRAGGLRAGDRGEGKHR